MRDPGGAKGDSSVFAQMLFVSIVLASFSGTPHLWAADDCARTSQMRVYSSAFIHKETGDLLGYELALSPATGSTMDVLLFVHEGSPGEGVPLSGRIQGEKLSVAGDWVEHLIEYPSKKEIVQKHLVTINGTLDERWFRGTIEIAGLTETQTIRLKRVQQIWMCKGKVTARTTQN